MTEMAPEIVSYPLSNQFQWRLRSVCIFHRHIEVVHERDQGFAARGDVHALGAFLEPTLDHVLKQTSSICPDTNTFRLHSLTSGKYRAHLHVLRGGLCGHVQGQHAVFLIV